MGRGKQGGKGGKGRRGGKSGPPRVAKTNLSERLKLFQKKKVTSSLEEAADLCEPAPELLEEEDDDEVKAPPRPEKKPEKKREPREHVPFERRRNAPDPSQTALFVAGSYCSQMVGWSWSTSKNLLIPRLNTCSHTGTVSCIGSGNRYLATGSVDEDVRVYCTTKLCDHGIIDENSTDITCLKFGRVGGNDTLFIGTKAGAIKVYGTRQFKGQYTLKGHAPARVFDLDPHPDLDQNKLVISCGADSRVKLQAFASGRIVRHLKFPITDPALFCRYAPDGETVVVVRSRALHVLSQQEFHVAPAKLAGAEGEEDAQSTGRVVKLDSGRTGCVTFLNPQLLAMGMENKEILVVDIIAGGVLSRLKGHEGRVKGIASMECGPSGDLSLEGQFTIFSACSAGQIKVWGVETSPPIEGGDESEDEQPKRKKRKKEVLPEPIVGGSLRGFAGMASLLLPTPEAPAREFALDQFRSAAGQLGCQSQCLYTKEVGADTRFTCGTLTFVDRVVAFSSGSSRPAQPVAKAPQSLQPAVRVERVGPAAPTIQGLAPAADPDHAPAEQAGGKRRVRFAG